VRAVQKHRIETLNKNRDVLERNEVSLSSPDYAQILLQRLDKKLLDADEWKEPRFSTAIG